jgi:hypothetical protein
MRIYVDRTPVKSLHLEKATSFSQLKLLPFLGLTIIEWRRKRTMAATNIKQLVPQGSAGRHIMSAVAYAQRRGCGIMRSLSSTSNGCAYFVFLDPLKPKLVAGSWGKSTNGCTAIARLTTIPHVTWHRRRTAQLG